MKFKIFKEVIGFYSFLEKIGFVFNIFQSVFSELIMAFLSAYIFDSVFSHTDDPYVALLCVGLGAVYFIFLVPLWGYWMEKGQARFKKIYTDHLMEKWIFANPATLHEIACAEFLTVQQLDVEKMSQFGGWPCVVLMQAILSGITAMISFSVISWKILVTLVLIGLIPLGMDIFFANKNRILFEKSREKTDEKESILLNLLNHQSMFRVFGQIEKRKEKFLKIQGDVLLLEKETANQNAIADLIHDLIYKGLYRFVILAGGMVLVARKEIEIGSVAFMLSMSEGLSFFLSDIGNYWRTIQELNVASEKLKNLSNELSQRKRAQRIYDDKVNGLIVKNVTFGYDIHDPVLKHLSIQFMEHKKYLITGNNGTGKSTLLKLLYGYLLSDKGKIYCAPSFSKPELSKKIGYVGQDIEIFSGSWLDCLNAENMDELKTILEVTHLTEVWKTHPMIMENGKNFSLGERSRIMIARVLLQKPDILLLDEIDAHIDSKTFQIILRNIESYLPTAIVIAVSHIQDSRAYQKFQRIEICDK